MSKHKLHIDSICIHGGQEPCEATGAVMPPIYTSSTYAQKSPGVHQGYEYSRSHNATRFAMERAMASLECSGISREQDTSHGAFAFASGLAASATCLELLDSNDTIVCGDDLYGGTYRLMTNVRKHSQGLNVVYVDSTNPDAIENAVQTHGARMIWVETPSNPTLKITDLERMAAIGKANDALTVVDNTFATPILQRPLTQGCDIVVHSITKYIGGHSDVVGGCLITGDPDIATKIRFMQNAVGSILGPFDSYLALRGLKTLSLRMRRHCSSAMEIAQWLEDHPKVHQVVYPGLPSHPQHDVASRQMMLDGGPGYGGMITIFLKGDIETSRRFLESVEIFALAESLGGVESLIEHPAIMTHASVPAEMRKELGISDSLVRLSVGIEDTADLIADLERALQAV